jgi:hypothetical protein
VLGGPGRPSYDPADPLGQWGQGASAHNVAIPSGRALSGSAWVTVSGRTIQLPAHAWALRDTQYGIAHERRVNIFGSTRTLRVFDSFGGAFFRQSWHLDPAWALVSAPLNGTTMVFQHPSGHRLTITTTGRLSGVQRGSTRPAAGWHFDGQTQPPIPSYQVTLRSYGSTVTTTFVVR